MKTRTLLRVAALVAGAGYVAYNQCGAPGGAHKHTAAPIATHAEAFTLGALSYWLLGSAGGSPWAFVVFAALIFLTWGEIYSLFPSTCTDSFGAKFATVNLSLLYTAKGASAFLVPVANMIKNATGSWHMVFVITAIMNLLVVAMALFVLKPMRTRATAQDSGRMAGAMQPGE